jgi:hypothetical protein
MGSVGLLLLPVQVVPGTGLSPPTFRGEEFRLTFPPLCANEVLTAQGMVVYASCSYKVVASFLRQVA